MKKGQIVKVLSGFYFIESNNIIYTTRGAGKLRLNNIVPVVGDIVSFNLKGFLEKIHKRKNFLIRPKVANIDQAIIVTSLKEPKYSSMLLNKMLAIIEWNNIKPIILFTKKDLTDFSPRKEYETLGYEVYEISNINKKGIEKLEYIFKNKLTVFTGQTGVGKSTTINSISGKNIKVQKISKSLGRGKHTTRVVEIIEWMGGKMIDTPGFSSFSINLTPLQLATSYHDFREGIKLCKFPKNCLHFNEKECEIKDRVKRGIISKKRYNDYINILKEALDENN